MSLGLFRDLTNKTFAGFSYQAPQGDSVPNAIANQTISNAQLSALIEFAPIQITGVDVVVIASISGGEMSVSTDGTTYGAYSTANQSIENNYWIKVRVLSSATVSQSTAATLSVGGIVSTFTTNTTVPITIDFIPRLLSTDIQEATVFKGRGNRVTVIVSHNGSVVDLSLFDRFELYGLTDSPIDSVVSTAIDTDDGAGVINIDVGELTNKAGAIKTTLVGYFNEYPEGVVLWHPSLAQAHLTINILNA